MYLNKITINPKNPNNYANQNFELMSEKVLKKLISDIFKYSKVAMPILNWKNQSFDLEVLKFYQKVIEEQKKYPTAHFINVLHLSSIQLNEKIIEFLQKNNFIISLKINIGEYKNNDLKLKKYLKNIIKILISIKRKKIEINPIIVLHNDLLNYTEKIYNFFKRNNISWIDFCPYCNDQSYLLNSDIQTPNSNKYSDFLCKLFDLWYKDFIKYQKSYITIKIFDSILYGKIYNSNIVCTFQQNYGSNLYLNFNGDVYPCECFVDIKYKLGNIIDYNFLLILNSKKQIDFIKKKINVLNNCKNCKYKSICNGGSLRDKLINLDPNKESNFCISYKKFFEYSNSKFIKLSNEIKKDFDKKFKKINK